MPVRPTLTACGRETGPPEPPAKSEIIDNQIVFVSDRGGHREIYVMNPDRSGVVNLLVSGGRPMVRSLAFVSRVEGTNEVFVMNADGTDS
jgi:hypothetical protein